MRLKQISLFVLWLAASIFAVGLCVQKANEAISPEYITCDLYECLAVGDETLLMVELPNGNIEGYTVEGTQEGNWSQVTFYCPDQNPLTWEVISYE